MDLKRISYFDTELNGKHLKIGTREYNPNITNVSLDKMKIDNKAFELIDVLSRMFNFTYEPVYPKQYLPGRPGESGDNLYGLLADKKIDMVGTLLLRNMSIPDIVEYSEVILPDSWSLIMRRPNPESKGLSAAFSDQLWNYIAGALFFYGPVAYLISKLRTKYIEYDSDQPITLLDCIFITNSAMLNQSSIKYAPKSNSARIIIVTWWLAAMILTSCYQANLTAFATAPHYKLRIKSLHDLVKYRAKWAAYAGGTVESLVRNPNGHLNFLEPMINQGLVVFIKSHLNPLNVIKDGYVYLTGETNGKQILLLDYVNNLRNNVAERYLCNYIIIPVALGLNTDRGFTYLPGSSIRTIMNIGIKRLKEAGIINKIFKHNNQIANVCPLDLNNKERIITKDDFYTLFLLICTCLLISVLVLVMEVFLFYYFNNKCRKYLCLKNVQLMRKKKSDLSKPPLYGSLNILRQPNPGDIPEKKFINGRYYWIVNTSTNGLRLIPFRALSSLAFYRQ